MKGRKLFFDLKKVTFSFLSPAISARPCFLLPGGGFFSGRKYVTTTCGTEFISLDSDPLILEGNEAGFGAIKITLMTQC